MREPRLRHRKKIAAALAIAVAFSIQTSLYAEDDRGRLPDGRAFRTDSAGTQLVDYIAELEVTNDALQRRVYGLEDEIVAKNQEISKLAGSKASSQAAQGVRERDLTSSNTKGGSEGDCSTVRRELARVSATLSEERLLAEQSIEEYQIRLTRLENENTLTKESQRVLECEQNLSQVHAALQRERGSAELERANWEQERVRTAAEMQTLRKSTDEIAREREQLTQQLAELSSARARAAALEKSTPQIPVTVVRTARRGEEPGAGLTSAQRQAYNRTLTMQDATKSGLDAVQSHSALRNPGVTSPHLIAARQRAVESLRGDFLSEINRINGLVRKRDASYKSFQADRPTTATAQAVKFQPAKAISSRGNNLAQLGNYAKSAESVSELNNLRRELSEIKAKIQDDIGLIDRMSR